MNWIVRIKKSIFSIAFHLQWFDYKVWLPLSTILPLPIGLAMSRWRGFFNRYTHRDWIELSVGFPYISKRAREGYRQIFYEATESQISKWVLGRYQTIAREEFEAQKAISGALVKNYKDHTVPILLDLKNRRTSGRGLVILLPHLDNLFLSCTILAKYLPKVHLITSSVVEHPQIHPVLRQFYREKYAAYEKLMRGGCFMHTSKAAKEFFYQALRRGEAVVILTDTPASKDANGCRVSWLGKQRKVPDGALKMATATGSEMVAVSSVWDGMDTLEWHMSDIVDPGTAEWTQEPPASALEAYQLLFSFMEMRIRQKPQAWWAAHLIQDETVV